MNKLLNILKTVGLKSYGFIQWTKQWHLFHIINCIPTFSVILFIIMCVANFELSTYTLPLFIVIFGSFIYIFEFTMIILTIAFITELALFVISKTKSFSPKVSNHFLLKNKIYNKIYIFNSIGIFLILIFILCVIIANIINKLS